MQASFWQQRLYGLTETAKKSTSYQKETKLILKKCTNESQFLKSWRFTCDCDFEAIEHDDHDDFKAIQISFTNSLIWLLVPAQRK